MILFKTWSIYAFMVIVLALALTGCIKDTCTQGDNMTNPHIVGEFNPLAENPVMKIGWEKGTERGADLPDSYFEHVSHYNQSRIKTAEYVKPMSIVVKFDNLAEYLSTNDKLHFELDFPDRGGFISCRHGGSSDTYYLFGDLTINNGVLKSAIFEQPIGYGAY